MSLMNTNPVAERPEMSIESEVARHLEEIHVGLSSSALRQEVLVAAHMRACFEAFVEPIRNEFVQTHPGAIPVLIAKHFSAVLIDVMAKQGIGPQNFLDLSLANNPELPRLDSPFYSEYGPKLRELEQLLQREIELRNNSDALTVWNYDRRLKESAGEDGGVLRLLGPRYSALSRQFPQATDEQVEAAITSYVSACRLKLNVK